MMESGSAVGDENKAATGVDVVDKEKKGDQVDGVTNGKETPPKDSGAVSTTPGAVSTNPTPSDSDSTATHTPTLKPKPSDSDSTATHTPTLKPSDSDSTATHTPTLNPNSTSAPTATPQQSEPQVSKWKLDAKTEKRLTKVHRRIGEIYYMVGNEPTIGFHHIQSHIAHTAPILHGMGQSLEDTKGDRERIVLDIQYARDTVNDWNLKVYDHMLLNFRKMLQK